MIVAIVFLYLPLFFFSSFFSLSLSFSSPFFFYHFFCVHSVATKQQQQGHNSNTTKPKTTPKEITETKETDWRNRDTMTTTGAPPLSHFARMHTAFAQQLTQRGVQGLEFRPLPSAAAQCGRRASRAAPIVVALDESERALLAQMGPTPPAPAAAAAATPPRRTGTGAAHRRRVDLRLDGDAPPPSAPWGGARPSQERPRTCLLQGRSAALELGPPLPPPSSSAHP